MGLLEESKTYLITPPGSENATRPVAGQSELEHGCNYKEKAGDEPDVHRFYVGDSGKGVGQAGNLKQQKV